MQTRTLNGITCFILKFQFTKINLDGKICPSYVFFMAQVKQETADLIIISVRVSCLCF